MLQRWIYMDAWISNNFIFIFFIIVKNYRKVKRLRQRLQGASEGLSIAKSLRSTFLSGAELLLFVLRIAPEQYGHKAYPQQKLFRNDIYSQ